MGEKMRSRDPRFRPRGARDSEITKPLLRQLSYGGDLISIADSEGYAMFSGENTDCCLLSCRLTCCADWGKSCSCDRSRPHLTGKTRGSPTRRRSESVPRRRMVHGKVDTGEASACWASKHTQSVKVGV